jgi:hypothetical protein
MHPGCTPENPMCTRCAPGVHPVYTPRNHRRLIPAQAGDSSGNWFVLKDMTRSIVTLTGYMGAGSGRRPELKHLRNVVALGTGNRHLRGCRLVRPNSDASL